MVHMFKSDAVFWKLFLLLQLLCCSFIYSWESIVCANLAFCIFGKNCEISILVL